MQRKPWPIIILAFIQVLSPAADVMMGAFHLGVNPLYYLSIIFRTYSGFQLVQDFCIAPLAGYAIFKVKRWSYPIFLACVSWIALSNYDAWQSQKLSLSLSALLTGYFLNLLLVSYFLLKQVRRTYFDPRVRWWESRPRYTLRGTALIKFRDEEETCRLINLSEGGAFIKSHLNLQPGDSLSLVYNCLGKEFQFTGEVLYPNSKKNSESTYGIRFILPLKKKRQLKTLIQAFELIGIERRPERMPWTQSLSIWLKEIFFERKGFIPEIPLSVPHSSDPERPKKKRSSSESTEETKTPRKPRKAA